MDVNLQLFGGRGGSSGVATATSMQDTYGEMSVAKEERMARTPPNEFFTSDEMDELSLMVRGKVKSAPSTVTDKPDFSPDGKVTSAIVSLRQGNLTQEQQIDALEGMLSKIRTGDTLRIDTGDGKARSYTNKGGGTWQTSYESRGHTIGYEGTIHGVSDDIMRNISRITSDNLESIATVKKRGKRKSAGKEEKK